MEGLKLGTLELAVAHDGAIATVHKPIGVLGIPFLYDNHEHAWRGLRLGVAEGLLRRHG